MGLPGLWLACLRDVHAGWHETGAAQASSEGTDVPNPSALHAERAPCTYRVHRHALDVDACREATLEQQGPVTQHPAKGIYGLLAIVRAGTGRRDHAISRELRPCGDDAPGVGRAMLEHTCFGTSKALGCPASSLAQPCLLPALTLKWPM